MRPNRGDTAEIVFDIILENSSIFPISRPRCKHIFLEAPSCERGTLAFQARRVRIDEASRQHRDDKGIAQATLDDAIPIARTHDMPDFASLAKSEPDWGLSAIPPREQALAQADAVDGTISIELHRSRLP